SCRSWRPSLQITRSLRAPPVVPRARAPLRVRSSPLAAPTLYGRAAESVQLRFEYRPSCKRHIRRKTLVSTLREDITIQIPFLSGASGVQSGGQSRGGLQQFGNDCPQEAPGVVGVLFQAYHSAVSKLNRPAIGIAAK